MKAMILGNCAPIETAPLRLREVSAPEPGPGEIRVKVAACGICRTDLHVIEGELPSTGHPVIPGHQVIGYVDKLGPGAHKYVVGTRVGIAWLHHTCGRCIFCRNGQENLCEHSVFTGYHVPGGYAEYTVAHEAFVYPIDAIFSDLEAPPLLCAGIIGYRSLKRSLCQPGQTLALYGFGSSAHIVIQIACYWGCKVYVCTRSQRHQKLSLDLGAIWAGANPEEMPVEVDSAIIFAPAGEIVPKALANLRKGGTLALAGIYMSAIPEMDYEKHLFYEKNLHSVTANTRQDGFELLKIAAEIPIKPKVQVFPMLDANEALLKLKRDSIEGSAVLSIG